MKRRRHHNNKGLQQIRNGNTVRQVESMSKRLALATFSEPVRVTQDNLMDVFIALGELLDCQDQNIKPEVSNDDRVDSGTSGRDTVLA